GARPSDGRDNAFGWVPELRSRADEVERRAAVAGELARCRRELAGVDSSDRRRQLPLEHGQLEPHERSRDDRVRPLEEVVDDLDLLRARSEAGECVDEALQPVVALDDLFGTPLLETVRLVVEDE